MYIYFWEWVIHIIFLHKSPWADDDDDDSTLHFTFIFRENERMKKDDTKWIIEFV